MAIEKSIDTEYGATAAYHRIMTTQVYFQDRCVDVTLAGYVSGEARAAGKSPLIASTTRLTFDTMGLVDGDEPTREAVYSALKALPEFANATDC